VKTLEKLTNIIEALLFVSGKEILIDEIAEKLEISKNEVKLAALELQEKYSGDCGLQFLFFNDKIQFGSNPEYGEAVSAVLNPIRERELSRSMLETAAIIAYKQPVTRMDLEELRGNSEYAIQNLLKLGIIEVVGRKDAVGKPVLFGTTDKFLKRFRISSLEQLPNYDELMEQVKLLNSNDTSYLYHKDVYVDDGTEDVMPPQRQFVPKTEEEVAITEEEPAIKDLAEEEVPEFLKDEDVELIENEDGDVDDYDEDYDDEEEDVEEDDGEFDDYSIDDEEYEDDEVEDDSDYEDEEIVDDDYEEDDL